MLEWRITNGDKNLKAQIDYWKMNFDSRFENSYLSKIYTKEQILSGHSPEQRIYYMVCKSFEEVKEKYPVLKTCSSCDAEMSEWIEVSFSFCDEYPCGMMLCKECAEKLKKQIEEWT